MSNWLLGAALVAGCALISARTIRKLVEKQLDRDTRLAAQRARVFGAKPRVEASEPGRRKPRLGFGRR